MGEEPGALLGPPLPKASVLREQPWWGSKGWRNIGPPAPGLPGAAAPGFSHRCLAAHREVLHQREECISRARPQPGEDGFHTLPEPVMSPASVLACDLIFLI